MRTVKIGDTVNWKGCFGMNAPLSVKVVAMELTEFPRSKYGVEVDEVTADMVAKNRVIFTLDNSHWAYADQVEIIEQSP
jgi:hypothetical protein